MSFHFKNIDSDVRELMLSEVEHDILNQILFYSKRFNDSGVNLYHSILKEAIKTGDEQILGLALKSNQCFKDKEERKTKNGVTMVAVPETAHLTFAEGEFNRFYVRGVCLKALNDGVEVCVYRARASANPRPESEALLGVKMNPEKLLLDLRTNIGVETALGLPQGPNSGLSVEIISVI